MDREYAVEYPDGEIFVPEGGRLDDALADSEWSEALGYGPGKIIVRENPEEAWVDA